jgi:Zn-dependent M28 family amino/carboxypeptidase
MYNTKGAYDNGAGAVVAVETAMMLAGKPGWPDVDIVLMDAEECRLEGSRYYASKTDADEVRFVVNIDGIGRGDIMEVWSGPEAFERKLVELLRTDGDFPNKVYKNPPPPGSDHAPFYEKGIDCCMFTVNDQDIIHTARDDYNADMLKNMEKMPAFIIKTIEGLL